MSGGRFGYIQSKLDWECIEPLEERINKGTYWDVDENIYGGNEEAPKLEPEVLLKLKEGLRIIKQARVYIHEIDYLLSGDTGVENFFIRLERDLSTIPKNDYEV